MLAAVFRRYEGSRQFVMEDPLGRGGMGTIGTGVSIGHDFSGEPKTKFTIGGNSVTLLTLLSLGAYITLVLTWRL